MVAIRLSHWHTLKRLKCIRKDSLQSPWLIRCNRYGQFVTTIAVANNNLIIL